MKFKAENRIQEALASQSISLDLRGLKLTSLPEEIGQLQNLQYLDLFDNRLESLPLEIFHLRQLKSLDLSANQLGSLPSEIFELRQLEKLSVWRNHLTSVPEEIFQLQQLRLLDLDFNHLTSLSEEITQLRQLQTLNLSGNHLTSLPEGIVQLQQLYVLNLSNNQLTSLPEEIAQLQQLRALSLSGNQFSSLPAEIVQLHQLKFLDLSGNELKSLPEEIAQLWQLKVLSLSENKLTSLPAEIIQLQQLDALDLAENQLTSLPTELTQLQQLDDLDLSGNQLTSLPGAISKLQRLQNLNLSGNQLRSLPPELSELRKLKFLGLDGNELSGELLAVYEVGLEALFSFLSQDQIEITEGKLVLVGEGAVGKSSLLGALRGDPWIEKRETTHGVEIKRLEVETVEGQTIHLNGWDFGGQGIYRATHQLFFTAPALYLAVWKPREGPELGQVEQWIKLVKNRTFDDEKPHEAPKVLVVATHGGPKERLAHIDEEGLRKQFPDLLETFHHVDSKDGDGIEDLEGAIAWTAASLPGIGRLVPVEWAKILEVIRERSQRDPWISYEDYLALAFEAGATTRNARRYAFMLNELGHIIYFGSDPLLKDTMILKPEWLSKAISFVLEDSLIQTQRGLVEESRLAEIWNDPARGEDRYPEALHPIFLRLMQNFDLIYKVARPRTSEATYLVAQLVPGARPDNFQTAWPVEVDPQEEEWIRVCHVIDAHNGEPARAEGLFYSLIVRLHQYSLGREDFEQSCHWQRGLVLEDAHNGRALIEQVGLHYRVTVRAVRPEGLLHQLTKEIQHLVESFWEGLDCRIAVPCQALCQGTIEIEEIDKFAGRGYSEVYCNTCKSFQPLDKLLPTPAPPPAARNLEAVQVQNAQQMSAEQKGFLSYIDSRFARLLESLTSEARNGPRLFTLTPAEPGFWDSPKWISKKAHLTLWCEHSRLPLPLLNGKDNKDGVYTVDLPRDWFVKALPIIKKVTFALSQGLPVVSAAVKLGIPEEQFKTFSNELDVATAGLKAGLQGTDKLLDAAPEEDLSAWGGRPLEAELGGASLRRLHAILMEKDPGFGGLVHVLNKRQEHLWVHPRFADDDRYRRAFSDDEE